jgi:hypothetical protein
VPSFLGSVAALARALRVQLSWQLCCLDPLLQGTHSVVNNGIAIEVHAVETVAQPLAMVLQIPYNISVIFNNIREVAGNSHVWQAVWNKKNPNKQIGWEFRRKKNDQLPRKIDKSSNFSAQKSREEAIFGFPRSQKTSVSFYIKLRRKIRSVRIPPFNRVERNTANTAVKCVFDKQ